MMPENERKNHSETSGKAFLSIFGFFRAFLSSILIMFMLNGCAGCGDVSLKGGVYACEPDTENACPAGWYCRRNSEGEYRCFTTPADLDASMVADGAVDGSMYDGGDVDAGCDCTEGDCCDGCNFLATDHRCDETPVGTALKCEELECGAKILEAVSYKYCSGTSAECDDSNIKGGGDWHERSSCNPGQACREDTSENAWCEDCGGLNCHYNNCCVGPQGVEEIPANCIDENCDGSDGLGDTTANLWMEIDPNPAPANSHVNVSVGATVGFTWVGITIQDPHGGEEFIDQPYITTSGNHRTWYWSDSDPVPADRRNPIPVQGPGKYKLIFSYNWDAQNDPEQREPLICRILKVN